MYKAVNNLPGENLSEFFVRNKRSILSLKVKILLAILDQ